MIEARETYQPLLCPRSPGKSTDHPRQQSDETLSSYGSLIGTALLHVDSEADYNPTNARLYQTSDAFTAQLLRPGIEPSEHTEYHNTVPKNKRASPSALSTAGAGLPPSIPQRGRRRAKSFDRNFRGSSTDSYSIHHRHDRIIRRSSSDLDDVIQTAEKSRSLSSLDTSASSPRRMRQMHSLKPPRQSSHQNNVALHSYWTIGSDVGGDGGSDVHMNSSMGHGLHTTVHPLHRHRPSDDKYFYSTLHRRTHSYDLLPGEDENRCRRNHNYSLTSYGLNSEAVKILPDPRWGGAVIGRSRTRSFGGNDSQHSIVNVDIGSYSTDSGELVGPFGGGGGGWINYGTNAKSYDTNLSRQVISNTTDSDQLHRHQFSKSDVSTASNASGLSIDQSVEPVITNMTKSVLYKGVTKKGIVKLQLPKDNFRLLSDRDLRK